MFTVVSPKTRTVASKHLLDEYKVLNKHALISLSHIFSTPLSIHSQEPANVAILSGKSLARHRHPKDRPFSHSRGGIASLEATGVSGTNSRAKTGYLRLRSVERGGETGHPFSCFLEPAALPTLSPEPVPHLAALVPPLLPAQRPLPVTCLGSGSGEHSSHRHSREHKCSLWATVVHRKYKLAPPSACAETALGV